MKRLSTIIMALALVLGMSQCKKQETPTNGNGGEGEMVHITLNVNDSESLAVNVNDNGGKHAVAPSLGVIQFTNGDKLYVGNNNHYVGYLNYVVDESGRRFEGNIVGSACSTSDKLHFYFLGGKGPDVTTISGNPESFTINISDQSTNLPVLCYGVSSQFYGENGENTKYSAVLEYKCALVKFNLNKETSYSCILSNMPTEATVSFATTSSNFTPIAKTSTTGNIDLYREQGNTGVRWAILLPGTNLSAAGNVSGAPSGTLNANQFINSGITLTNPVFAAPDAQYAVKTSGGVLTQFSVSSTQKVYFSRANLRYGESLSSIPGWSLHAHQFDEHEDAYGDHGYGTHTGYNATYDLDRICWGRLAHDGNYTYTAGGSWIYADNLDLTRTNGTDWGTVLTTEGNNWRMLTASEWNYLFNGANNVRGTRRFLKVCVNAAEGVGTAYGVHTNNNFGVLLLPDLYNGQGLSMKDWKGNTYTFNNKDGGPVRINLTSDGTDDVSKMLNAGAVFLPALGYRNADQYVTEQYQDYTYYDPMSVSNKYVGIGYYWSSTRVDSYGVNETDRMAKLLKFDYTINAYSEMLRGRGACVRLVWDAN